MRPSSSSWNNELSPSGVDPAKADRIKHLLPSNYPNLAFIYAALEGRIPGNIWTDSNPTYGSRYLVTTESPFCFIAGAIDDNFLVATLSVLKQRKELKLIYPASLQLDTRILPGNRVVSTRLQYSLPAASDCLVQSIPKELRLVPINEQLFERLGWKDRLLEIYGSSRNFLRASFGFCLLHKDVVAAEAYNVLGGGIGEPGMYTHPSYRRRGLPSIVMGETIRHATQGGLQTVVTCEAANIATATICDRLGLRLDMKYEVISHA
ncbi:GNAT family N-acetyltransferase [Streptomyces chryseus]